jgi:signal transduction histidine kinase
LKARLGIPVLLLALCAAFLLNGALPRLFAAGYMPHLYCYLGQPGLIWTNAITDGLIAASYGGIFVCLLLLAWRLRGVERFSSYLWIFVCFGLFIAACGLTHVMEIVTIWWPVYPLSAAVKVLCALASVPTAILFARAAPGLAGQGMLFVAMLSSTQQERDAARAALLAAEQIQVEQQRAEARIAAAHDTLNHIMDSTSEAIVKLDFNWKVVYVNRRGLQIAPGMIPGADFWTCFPDIVGTIGEENVRGAMQGQVAVEYERYNETVGQWVQANAYPTPQGISLFIRIVSEQKRLQHELDAERNLREKRIVALSNMAGGLAHEISNPLAIIHGTASDLESSAAEGMPVAPDEVKRAAETIVRTSDRAMRILRGLRGFAREASDDPMEPASIYEIVGQAIELQEARFERHHIALRAELPAGLPLLWCRETQIGQIVNNLLNNSFDAIRERECVVRWVEVRVADLGDRLQLDVVDSGLGVDEATRAKLMDPFFTTKTRGMGMGVGLSLSSAIAIEHHGSLGLVQGTPNTCFRLILRIPRTATAGNGGGDADGTG